MEHLLKRLIALLAQWFNGARVWDMGRRCFRTSSGNLVCWFSLLTRSSSCTHTLTIFCCKPQAGSVLNTGSCLGIGHSPEQSSACCHVAIMHTHSALSVAMTTFTMSPSRLALEQAAYICFSCRCNACFIPGSHPLSESWRRVIHLTSLSTSVVFCCGA